MSDREDALPSSDSAANSGDSPGPGAISAPPLMGSPQGWIDPSAPAASVNLAIAANPYTSKPAPPAPAPLKLEPEGRGLAARFERTLAALGDRLNPILVKETRQAVKSRQFTLWFSLLLGLGWLWSFFGVIQIGSAIYDGAYGADLLFGYYTLLSFCLLVVVPFVSFRSLSLEREERTYDLLQITTLRPSQIIAGKLGSAAAQMLLYGSAIAPCLAFTYLLRGVPLIVMGLIFVYLMLASMGLSMLGIFAATLARHRAWQTVMMLVLILGLLWTFVMALPIVGEALTRFQIDPSNADFWLGNGMIVTAYVGAFALLFVISTAEITFPADNRSTPGRITTMAVQAAFTGWCGYGWLYLAERDEGMLAVFVIFSLSFWYLVGMVLESEPAEPSRRVRRGLPTSFLGRVALTWLYPGPSSGYVFAATNALAVAIIAIVAFPYSKHMSAVPDGRLMRLSEVGFAYLALYLGLGNLMGALVRRAWSVPHAPALLINLMLVLGGIAAPMLLQFIVESYATTPSPPWSYSLWHASNPFWTMYALMDGNSGLPPPRDALWATWIVVIASLIVGLLNVPAVVHEIRFTRAPAPERVKQDDEDLRPAPVVVAAPAGPWD